MPFGLPVGVNLGSVPLHQGVANLTEAIDLWVAAAGQVGRVADIETLWFIEHQRRLSFEEPFDPHHLVRSRGDIGDADVSGVSLLLFHIASRVA